MISTLGLTGSWFTIWSGESKARNQYFFLLLFIFTSYLTLPKLPVYLINTHIYIHYLYFYYLLILVSIIDVWINELSSVQFWINQLSIYCSTTLSWVGYNWTCLQHYHKPESEWCLVFPPIIGLWMWTGARGGKILLGTVDKLKAK